MIYLTLFLEFFKTGLFSVGGGLATIPFLQDMAMRYGWISQEALLNMIGVAESTPGPIGINVATYMGYETAGILGGLIAVLGLVMPSLILIIVIAQVFNTFKSSAIVQSAFKGIRPMVAGLIGAAGFEVAKIVMVETQWMVAVLLVGLTLFAIEKYQKHPIVYLIGGGLIGILFKL